MTYAWQDHIGSVIPSEIQPDMLVDILRDDAMAYDTVRAGDVDWSGATGLIALWRRHQFADPGAAL